MRKIPAVLAWPGMWDEAELWETRRCSRGDEKMLARWWILGLGLLLAGPLSAAEVVGQRMKDLLRLGARFRMDLYNSTK